ncbi:MAG TPA: M23 family metallopeptidase [Propionibacteriaceae bacterium]|nr:M23 family metallopeptidase [Propionibacteriaceae bacterium]
MRELSGEQQTEREGDQDVSSEPEPDQGKGWLWHGFAALGVSALGLAVAAAVGLTTNAETTRDLSAVPDTSPTVAKAPVETVDQQRAKQSVKDPALAAFGRRNTSASNQSSRSATVRDALVREQAAQRDELLAKTADEISRAAQSASSDARQKKLQVADRATREAAAQIAAENLRRAIAARVAAANKRRTAESQPSSPEVASSKSDKDKRDTAGESGSDSGSASDRGSGNSSAGGGSSGGVSPVPGAVIGAHFGEYGSWSRYHTGLDFRASYGTPIRAVKAGVVLYAGNSGDWAGNHVAIKHADGMTTMSSHMSSMAVSAGQTVRAGQVIGHVGQTGRAFGAHLHFEVYPAGVKYGDVYKAINPQPWLAANGVTTH